MRLDEKNTLRHIRLELILSIIIGAVSLLTFSRVLTSDFVMWDDDVAIYLNSKLVGSNLECIKWAFTDVDSTMRYIPLTLLGWSLTHHLWGFDPFWFHLGNLLLHAFNSILVFWLIRKILLLKINDPNGVEPLWINLSAFVATLIWAIHPLRVEPVSWATDRTYCQSTFFLLVSLLLYLRANDKDITSPYKRTFLYLSLLCYIFSLLSHPISITFIMVLIVIDVSLLKRLGGEKGWMRSASARKALLEKMPFFCAGVFISVITVVVRLASAGVWSKPMPLSEFGLIDRFMQAVYILAYYIWKPWYPENLSPLYTTLVNFNPFSLPFIGSAMLVFGLGVVLVLARRRCGLGLALFICHIVLLIPVLGLFEHPHYHCDRYSYIVSICWSVFLAYWLARIRERKTLFVLSVGLVIPVGCLLGLLSFQQTKIWNNSITLFEHMIKKLGNDPYRHEIYWRLGLFYKQQGDTTKALNLFDKVFEIDPNYPRAHFAVSQIYIEKGNIDDAIIHLEKAVSPDREGAFSANNLAWYLATRKDSKFYNPQKAIKYAEMACDLTDYKKPEILETSAVSYASAGEFSKAVETSEKALKLAFSSDQKDLADSINTKMNLFKSGRPYIERPIANVSSKDEGSKNVP